MQIPSVPSTIFICPRAVTPRLLATLLFAVMAATLLSACGGEDAPPATAAPEPTATQVPDPAPTATQAPEAVPTATQVPKPVPTPIPTPVPSPEVADPESSDEPKELTAEDLISLDLGFPRFSHNATLLNDGRILVSGGYTGIANNDTIFPLPVGLLQLFDPSTGYWSALEPLEGPGFAYSAVALNDGRVLLAGLGVPQAIELSMASIFDPATDTWSSVAAPSDPRAWPDLVPLADGRVLAVGGVDFLSGDLYDRPTVQSVEIFDPATESWQTADGMVEHSTDQLLFPLNDGRVVAFARVEDSKSDDITQGRIYDPTRGSWRVLENTEPYYALTDAVQLSDGRYLVLGTVSAKDGYSESNGRLSYVQLPDGRELYREEIARVLPDAMVYDPVANSWAPAHGMSALREEATLTLLPDGRVLVAGGEDPDSYDYVYYTSTEIYDPVTNAWYPGPDLSGPRASHTATLMPDSTVMLSGGITVNPENDERHPTWTTEIVSP